MKYMLKVTFVVQQILFNFTMKLLIVIPLLFSFCLSKIRVGMPVNIFNGYGNLEPLMHLPENNDERKILDSVGTNSDLTSEDLTTFDLRLCDNMEQLKESLYQDWKVEGVEKSGKVFTGGWGRGFTAVSLGLNTSHVSGDYSFALVQLVKPRLQREQGLSTGDLIQPLCPMTKYIPCHKFAVEEVQIAHVKATNQTSKRISRILPGDQQNIKHFFKEIGTHYISSYTTGDSLSQIFMFSPKVYLKLQDTFEQYRESTVSFKQVLRFFSPLRSEYIGRILSSSGDKHLEHWAHLNLLTHLPGFPAFPYSSLLQLHSDPYLLDELTDAFEDDAILSVDLKSLAVFFPEERKRVWFEEVLSNHIQMWENNF